MLIDPGQFFFYFPFCEPLFDRANALCGLGTELLVLSKKPLAPPPRKKKKKKAGCEKKYLKDSSEWKPSSETLLTVAPPKGARDHSTLQGCPISTIVEEEFMEAI